MINPTRSFIATFIVLLFLPLLLFAEEQPAIDIISDGISKIVGDNTAKARESTIDDALRKAVEQTIVTLVSNEMIDQHSETLDKHIYSHAKGYVQNFRVLSEKVTGNLYQVTVQATVSPEILKTELAKLGLITSQINMPKVIVMVAESIVKDIAPAYWWAEDGSELAVSEQVLISKLLEKDFNIINPLTIKEKSIIPASFRTDSLSDEALKELGSLFEADLVIYGRALASTMDFITDRSVISSQADISLKAVKTSDGKVVATSINHESAVHLNDYYAGMAALRKTTEELSENFLMKIIKNWRKTEGSSNSIKMVISGIKSYSDFTRFKNILQNQIRSVSGVSQRGFSSGVATLNVETEGTSQALADMLTLVSYEGFAIDITGITPNGMQIKMRPR